MNADRSAAGLPTLVPDAGLATIARTRSQQMADQNYFAETDPFGYSMSRELLAYYGYTGYLWTGENISMNNEAETVTAESAMSSIMADPIHRANILATDYTRGRGRRGDDRRRPPHLHDDLPRLENSVALLGQCRVRPAPA